jgi:hypothetical protein
MARGGKFALIKTKRLMSDKYGFNYNIDKGKCQGKISDCRSKVIMSPHTKVEMSPLWYTVRLFTNHTVYDIYHYVYKRIGSFDRN